MITNIGEIKRAHASLIRDTKSAIDRELDEAAEHAQHHVKRNKKFRRRSGRLEASLKARGMRRGSVGQMRLRATAKHASFIEYGTRAHIIRARRKKSLRFRGSGGGVVFAKQVRHPGTRPYKYGWNATWAAYRFFGPRAQRRLGRIAARF